MSRSSKLHGALAVCVFLFIGLGLALSRPGLMNYAPYLSFSPDKDGVKAVRLLMEQEGADVKEWRLAPERLPDGKGQLFLAIEPYGVAHESSMKLVEWAEQGNEVVVFGAFPYWLKDWDMEFIDPAESDGKVTAVGASGGSRAFEAPVDTEIRFVPEAPARHSEALLRDAAGVLAVRQSVGEGGITISAPSEWMMNENILEGERFELLWMLLGGEALNGRTVFIDEYHHGYSVSPGMTQVYPMWLLAAAAQAALGFGAWLWWRGKRFGPAYTPRAFLVRRGDETLLAVAGWYRRGRLTFEALDHNVERLRRVLQLRGGVPASAGAGQLYAAAERTLEGNRMPPGQLRDVLERWESLRREKETGGRVAYSDKAWLADSIVLDETLKTLEEDK
jgi:hypothetical protein